LCIAYPKPYTPPIVQNPEIRYNKGVKQISRIGLTLCAVLVLAQCSPQEESPIEGDDAGVIGAQTGIAWTVLLSNELNMQNIRPSGLLGVYVTHFLLESTTLRGAVMGIDAQMVLYFGDELEKSESFALLEELGTILQVDVADMLNRSINRGKAFDTYVDSLKEILIDCTDHNEGLKQDYEEISEERRAKRRTAGDLQHDLNVALREQDYTTAGAKQSDLIDAETDLATVEARQEEIESIMDLFEDLIDVGTERVIAMEENREIIIAGLMVVEVPGIDDLGLIKETNRRGRRNGRSIFDPSAN